MGKHRLAWRTWTAPPVNPRGGDDVPWLITVCNGGGNAPWMFASKQHPAEWLAERNADPHGTGKRPYHLLCALEITEEQAIAVDEEYTEDEG
jgi:hypothetical protein